MVGESRLHHNDMNVDDLHTSSRSSHVDPHIDAEYLLAWLQEEVKQRLLGIECKLDKLTQNYEPSGEVCAVCGIRDQNQEVSVVGSLAPSMCMQSVSAERTAKLLQNQAQSRDVQLFADSFHHEVSMPTDPTPQDSSSEQDAGGTKHGASNEVGDDAGNGVESLAMSNKSDRFSSDLRGLRHRNSLITQVFLLLEKPDSGRWAKAYSILMQFLTVASVCLAMSQTVLWQIPVKNHRLTFGVVETALDALLTLDVCVRLFVSPNAVMFFRNPHNWIDVTASIPPLIIGAMSGCIRPTEAENAAVHYFLLQILPFFRLLKLLRRFEKFNLLFSAFQISLEALPFLLFTLLLAVIGFSCAIFMVEPRTNIPALPVAMWLTIMSMTTIGYGDLYPVTTAGRIIISALSIFSAMYMALPIGIIGNAFSQVWGDRNKLQLTHRFRRYLAQAGFTAFDIPELFYLFDSDKDGHLSLPELEKMISEMQTALTVEDIVELFDILDIDRSGTIDDSEFVRALWPHLVVQVYRNI